MGITTRGIIRKAADTLTTGGVTSGLLNPEQSRRFTRIYHRYNGPCDTTIPPGILRQSGRARGI